MVFSYKVTFDDARASCQSEGGDFPSILNVETNDYFKELSKGEPVWIGGER